MAKLARETHAADPAPPGGLRIQISFSYSDGFGREIQKKMQNEPGPVVDGGPIVAPRWTGSGWTIFNNKGKPVRQYEPFFTATHAFEFDLRAGVSPVLFYDPVERVVATLHPNHSWEKVVFDPWRQENWDVNDTVLLDPGTDGEVQSFFLRLPDVDYLPTWDEQRKGGALGPDEQQAAAKTARHADTPSVAHFDALGRVFLTIADNGKDQKYETRNVLDIEGNQCAVIDALNRVVMRYDYDILSIRIHQASMEAGERWTLNDVTGKSIRAWDTRGHNFRTDYDALRRPGSLFVQGTDAANSDSRTLTEVLYHQVIYGEGQPNDVALNLRTRVFRVGDTAGLVTNMDLNPLSGLPEAYDFKGNLLRGRRQFIADYKVLPNWSAPPLLGDIFTGSTQYDALNRPIAATTPDGSVTRLTYNAASLLETVGINLRGEATQTPFITNMEYDAKCRRRLIDYGNGARTTYDYDPLTFRLTHILTRRSRVDFPDDCRQPPPPNWPGCQVQNLVYTYDPVGNITRIRDNAQQTIYFRNRRVEPSNDYTYDAIYRLTQATGREQLGLGSNGKPHPPTASSYNDVPRIGLLSPSDGNAMGTYTEQYLYDPVGSFLQFIHRGSNPGNPGWTRSYAYADASLLEPPKFNNRLTSTTVSGSQSLNESYTYDMHGNMTSMPQLQAMQWTFKDELQMSRRQAVNAGDAEGILHQGERTYYVYDGNGQRAWKISESAAGVRRKERYYVGGFEVYREYDSGGGVTLERESLHVMDARQRVALVETRTHGTDPAPPQLIRYQLGNHLGSVSLEIDNAGRVISYEEYCPYGNTSYLAGRTVTEVSLKRYRYSGMERDYESGLNYHGARYCASWLGRWASCDPTGLADSLNLYEYAKCAPTVLADQTGTDSGVPSDEEIAKIEDRYQVLKAVWLYGLPRLSNEGLLTDQQIATIKDRITVLKQVSRTLDHAGYSTDASLMNHLIGNLLSDVKIAERQASNPYWRRRLDNPDWVADWQANRLSEDNKSYWSAKLDHPEWEVNSNVLNMMTDQIVKASQSTDVQLFQAAVVGTITANAMSRPSAATASGEFEARDIANPPLKNEPTVIDSDADYSGLPERFANKLRETGARRTENFVTFDNPIGASRGQSGKIMKALNAWLGPEKRGAGTWQSGTHGNESGIYGRSDQLDPNFLGRDIAEGRYSNWDAQPFTNPLPEVFGPGKICVLGWCFSTASLARARQ